MPEPQTESTSLLNGLPQWAKVIGYIGLPGALIVYVLYIILGSGDGLAAKVSDIKDAQAVHIQQSDDHHKEFHEAEQRRESDSAVIRDLLRAQCVNAAANPEERARCFPPVVK